MMKAKVYKRHGVTQMCLSARDVNDCDYGSGQCELHSGGGIVWNVDAEENCLSCHIEIFLVHCLLKKINICGLLMTYNWFCLFRAI